MKDLMKKMLDKGTPSHASDMQANAKLRVLGHLRNMASGMMSGDLKSKMPQPEPAASAVGYSKGGMVKPEDEGLEAKSPTVPELNSMDNQETGQDFNEEHTPESLQEEIDRLKEMKRRVTEGTF